MFAMATMITRDQLVKLLQKRQGGRAQRELAEELGISPAYLSDIYLGKRDPGESVLEKLGLEKQTVYVKVA